MLPNLKVNKCGMIVNETTIHQNSNRLVVCNYNITKYSLLVVRHKKLTDDGTSTADCPSLTQ